jgi:peroxiredoxin
MRKNHRPRATLTLLALLLLAAAMAYGCSLIHNIPLNNGGVAVGRPAPDFTLQDAAGNWHSLSDFRGRKILLFNWSSWCRCKYQLPAMQEFYLKHKSDGFELLAVASEAQGFKWAGRYLEKAGVTFPVLVDPNDSLASSYNFWATENAWLIDEAGIVRMNEVGFDIRNPEQHARLLEAMALPTPGPSEPPARRPLDERVAARQKEVADAPWRLAARFDLADLLRQQGKLKAAEDVLDRAVRLDPLSAEARWRQGVVRYEQGRSPEALAAWEQARKLAPTNYIYLRNVQAYLDPDRFYAELSCGGGQ